MVKLLGNLRSSRAALVGGLLALGFFPTPVRPISVEEVVVADFLQPKQIILRGWDLSVHEGEPDLTLVPDGGGQALKLRSRLSSFSLTKAVDVDLKRTPYLEWMWKVTELPKGGDFRQIATDDQAAQLIVVFSWGALRQEVIMYMWDSTAPEGTASRVPSPPLSVPEPSGVVVRSGDQRENGSLRRETWSQTIRGSSEGTREGSGNQDPDQHPAYQIPGRGLWRSVKFKAQR
jgi:hypothetical protein